jgi:hypothetical protein
MIFRQRMPMSDLAGHTWALTYTELLRALNVLANLWTERTSRLYAWTMENSQILTGVTIGIFIGSGALAFLTGDLLFTIGYGLPFWFASMRELSQQQGTQVQNVEQLLAQQASEQIKLQQGQHQAGKDDMLRITASISDDEDMTRLVEDALRHLYDYSCLGQHQLAQLQFLQRQQQLCSGTPSLNNHLELGRALRSFLVDIIGQLRPTGQLPTSAVVPQREWHPYIILHASYVQGELTREIMARLYISEGNYNRTRRRAIDSVARAILEIEQQTRAHTVGS